jgi:hypothetical protein
MAHDKYSKLLLAVFYTPLGSFQRLDRQLQQFPPLTYSTGNHQCGRHSLIPMIWVGSVCIIALSLMLHISGARTSFSLVKVLSTLVHFIITSATCSPCTCPAPLNLVSPIFEPHAVRE